MMKTKLKGKHILRTTFALVLTVCMTFGLLPALPVQAAALVLTNDSDQATQTLTIPDGGAVGDLTAPTLKLTSDGTEVDDFSTVTSWISSDTGVATITNGTIALVGVGTTDITATIDPDTSSAFKLTIEQAPPSAGAATLLDADGASSKTLTIAAGETVADLTAPVLTFTGTDGSTITNSEATWVSDTPSVATVDAGVITLVGVGATIITATKDANTATYTLTIASAGPTPPKAITLDMIEDITGLVFNSQPQQPPLAIEETVGGTALALGVDYTVKYEDNVNAGTDSAKAIVTGIGNYKGTVTKTFSIAKGDAPTLVATDVTIPVDADGTRSFDLNEHITGIPTKAGKVTYVFGTFTDTNSALAGTPVLDNVDASRATYTVAGAGDATVEVTVTMANYASPAALTLNIKVLPFTFEGHTGANMEGFKLATDLKYNTNKTWKDYITFDATKMVAKNGDEVLSGGTFKLYLANENIAADGTDGDDDDYAPFAPNARPNAGSYKYKLTYQRDGKELIVSEGATTPEATTPSAAQTTPVVITKDDALIGAAVTITQNILKSATGVVSVKLTVLPEDAGEVTYGTPDEANKGTVIESAAAVENGVLPLTLADLSSADDTDTGTVTVVATTDNYADTTITVTLNVSTLTFTVVDDGFTFMNITQPYGTALDAMGDYDEDDITAKEGDAEVEGTYTLLLNNEKTTLDTIPDAGTHTLSVVFRKTGTTEDILVRTATITIQPKNVALTWSTDPLTYNGQMQTLPYTIPEGTFVSGDEVTVTSKKYSDVDTTHALDATLTGKDADNYTLMNGTRNFTIKPIEAQLSWGNTRLFFTGATQTLTATITNLVPGEDATVTATTTSANVGSGSVAVSTVAGANSGNYTVAAGTMVSYTINPAPIKGTLTIRSNALNAMVENTHLLTATVTAGFANPTYQWYKNDEKIDSATSATYQLATTNAKSGDKFTCKVTYGYLDGEKWVSNAQGELVSNIIEVGKTELAASAISITGGTTVGSEMTATLTLTAPDPSTPGFKQENYVRTYWLRNNEPIPGATGMKYTLTKEDLGKSISFKAVGIHSNYSGTLFASAQSITPVAPDAPKIRLTPNSGRMTVSWEIPFNGGSDITGYTLKYEDETGEIVTVSPSPSATARSCVVEDLENGKEYTFELMVTTGSGSATSVPVSGVPTPQFDDDDDDYLTQPDDDEDDEEDDDDDDEDDPTEDLPDSSADVDDAVIENGEATVTVDADSESDDDVATTKLSEDTLDEAVSEALDAAEDEGVTPVINVVVPTMSGDKVVKAILPVDALEDFAENADSKLTVSSNIGTVSFDAQALESITDESNATNIVVQVAEMDKEELNSRQRDVVGDSPVYDLNVLSGNTIINDFDGGKVTVEMPYELKDGEDPEDIVVYFINNEGNIEAMETVYEDGKVRFTTTHFSYYVIGTKDYVTTLPTINPFTDVLSTAWYYSAVMYAYQGALFNGTSETTFSPDSVMTRAMLVTVLHRMDGGASVEGSLAFADVASDEWYSEAVLWASTNNLVTGYDEVTFGPNDNITREQMALILYRYASMKGYDITPTTDLTTLPDGATVSSWAKEAMQWAYASKLITGNADGTLDPQGMATRAQVATILMRFEKEYVK